ncbi:MAG: M15 family metallopeptidase [Microthrixaceae bacterium]
MDRRRWLLVAVGAALIVSTAAYAAVRDDGGSASPPAPQRSTTTTGRPTITTLADTTTSTSSTTTVAPTPSSTTSRPAAATTSTAPAPPFQSSIEPVTAEQLGASWTAGMGCAAPEQLRAVNVSHWGDDGAVRVGRLVVAADHADRIVSVFRDIYAARFPIARMVPIDAYGGDDQASMRANNTSGFNCRYVSGTTKLSQHAYGRAVDVNPLVNPYVRGSTVDPPEGAPYADRRRRDPGMIHAGDAVVDAFAAQGWGWGGSWSSGKDYQHFSSTGG